MKKVLTLFTVLFLVSCASSQKVVLRHPATGEMVTCGPYLVGGNIASAARTAQNELRYCIEDFKQQGFVRAPSN